MKRFKIFAFSILTLMFMVMGVNASGDVAKVGSNSYDLDEFVAYLSQTKTNDEIVLLQDLNLTNILPEGDIYYVPFADNVTFDLNGHSVTSKNATIRYMGNNLTIKNGKFIVNGYGTQNEGSYALFLGHKSGATQGYTLENLVLEGGLNVFNATGVELNNVTATGTNYYAVWADFESEITIKSGSYSSKSGVILNNEETTGLITVQGGTFDDFIPGIYVGAGSPITVKLTEDMELNGTKELFGNITIDLNGHNIIQKKSGANVFNVISGDINITGEGKIISHDSASNAIRIYGSTEVEDKEFTKVTIGKDVTVESNGYAAFITPTNKRAYGVEVNIYGTLKGGYNGFFVNGQIQDVDKNEFKNFPVINIHDGAFVEGVYAAGYATWNIGAATIEDEGYGLGIKAGKFVIDGATIKATGAKEEPKANNDGISYTGSAIQFETSDNYADHIDMIIKNATVTSTNGYAFLEYLGQTEILNLQIKNGTFKSAKGLDVFKVTEEFNKTGFITGGTYSADVNAYVAKDYKAVKVNNEYVVSSELEIKTEIKNGKIAFDKEVFYYNDEVTLTITPEKGYELKTVLVKDALGNEIEVKDNKFVMPNSNVTVTVEISKIEVNADVPVVDTKEEVKEVTVGVKEDSKVEEVLLESLKENEEIAKVAEKESVKVEVAIDEVKVSEKSEKEFKEVAGNATIATYFDIEINVKKVSDGQVVGNLTNLSKEIELMVLLPEDLRNTDESVTREYFIIREHTEGGKTTVEKIKATVSEDGKYLVFKSDKFSTYALAYEDVKKVVEEDNTPEVKPEEKPNVPETPKTGDNLGIYVVLGFGSIAAIYVSLNSLKKRRSH